MTCNKRCLWVSFVGDKNNNNKTKGIFGREVRRRDKRERLYGVFIACARRPCRPATITVLYT